MLVSWRRVFEVWGACSSWELISSLLVAAPPFQNAPQVSSSPTRYLRRLALYILSILGLRLLAGTVEKGPWCPSPE